MQHCFDGLNVFRQEYFYVITEIKLAMTEIITTILHCLMAVSRAAGWKVAFRET